MRKTVVVVVFDKTIRDRMRKSRLSHTFFKTEKPDYTPKIMKFCPTCQTRFDEEILRFCTKDGTPLIEETQPNFTELPSESATDDSDEETIVRRKPAATAALPYPPEEKPATAPRIVIPTSEERPAPQQQQVRTNQAVYQSPQKSNTAKVVLLTALGTIILLAGAGGVFWMLQSEENDNANPGANSNVFNVNTNPPTNLNIDNSFNFNVGSNANTNVNINANIRTPTPTPKPTPSPSPSPRRTPDANSGNSANTNSAPPANTRPSPSPSPLPTGTPTPPAVNRPVNAGILNSRAVNLTTPAYPASAKAMRAVGRVMVQVMLDESGNVMSAKATSGHPLLRQSAEAAARQSRFNPIKVNNQAVAATGVLVYNFIN